MLKFSSPFPPVFTEHMEQCSYRLSRRDETAVRQLFTDLNAKKEEHKDIGIEIQCRWLTGEACQQRKEVNTCPWRRKSSRKSWFKHPLKRYTKIVFINIIFLIFQKKKCFNNCQFVNWNYTCVTTSNILLCSRTEQTLLIESKQKYLEGFHSVFSKEKHKKGNIVSTQLA